MAHAATYYLQTLRSMHQLSPYNRHAQ